MTEDNSTRYFSAWWAILFVFLTFNLIPIPFALLIGSLGDWVYQNPVLVDMNYLGEVKLHPIADNLTPIFSMTVVVAFIVWRMKKRNIDLNDLGSLSINKRDIFYGSLMLFTFIVLEEIYMWALNIEMPEGFVTFMLSDPIILGLISVIIIAPIAEEFIFRGFLFSQLKRTQLGGWGAVSLSSFLWTIIHFQYELLILFVLFVFDVFLGYVRMAYNSLSLPIILHAINNAFAFVLAYFFY